MAAATGDGAGCEFDQFLSFCSPHRELARNVAQHLKAQHGLRVFFDAESIVTGTRWVEALGDGLKKARGLVGLIPEHPSHWQASEVSAFQQESDLDPSRFVIPVFLEAQPNLPGVLAAAFQGIDGRGRSSAEIAEAVAKAFRRRTDPRTASASAATGHALWSEAEALAAYRSWVAAQHEKLIPYFKGAADYLLEEIYVAVDVETMDPRSASEATDEASKPSTTDRSRTSLESLLFEKSGSAARVVVMGEPGAGKTTLARALARKQALGDSRTPLFLPLARIGRGAFDPIRYAVEDMLGSGSADTPKAQVLTRALESESQGGRLFLLLDGLDEVDASRVDSLLEAILRVAKERPAAPFAILGRPIIFERRDLPREARRARVLSLPVDRQDELLRHLLGADEAAAVRAHLNSRPALAELARSPLLLTLIAVVARDTVLVEGALPSSRSRLYQTAIDLLLRRGFGIEKKGVADTGPARRVLQALSFRLHDQGGESWTRAELSEHLTALRRADEGINFDVKETEAWKSNDRLLDDIGNNSGILGPHDGPNLPWRYLHRSLREFLAAEELARRPEAEVRAHLAAWIGEAMDSEKRRQKQETPAKDPARWGEVFALYAGIAPAPKPILDALIAASENLALRTLASIDGLSSQEVLALALSVPSVDDAWVAKFLRQSGLVGPKVRALLDAVVSPAVPIHGLGVLWQALESIGAPPEGESFFRRAGRWPEGGPPSHPSLPIPPEGTSFEFLMGSPKGEGNDQERPQRRVRLSPFRLGTTAVTWEQFRALDPSCKPPDGDGPAQPVRAISWYEARLFAHWVGGDLPTEAQWEGACRAGTTTAWSTGSNVDDAFGAATWYDANSEGRPHPVAQKEPNPWGLFDMYGNVREWCLDWYRKYKRAEGDVVVDPLVLTNATGRVLRGGSYWDVAWWCRAACRDGGGSTIRFDYVGFRVAFPAAPSSSFDH